MYVCREEGLSSVARTCAFSGAAEIRPVTVPKSEKGPVYHK
jgi:hypothetical protein